METGDGDLAFLGPTQQQDTSHWLSARRPSLASLGLRDSLLLCAEEPTLSCQEKDQPLVTDWGKERVGEMYEKVRTVTVHCTLYTLNYVQGEDSQPADQCRCTGQESTGSNSEVYSNTVYCRYSYRRHIIVFNLMCLTPRVCPVLSAQDKSLISLKLSLVWSEYFCLVPE